MKTIYRTVLLTGLAALALPVHAEEPAASPARKWKDKAEVALISTNGNSKGTTTSIKNFYSYKWSDMTGLELVGGGYGSSNANSVTAENYNASEKVTWKLAGKTYVYERFGWDKDRFAGIRNRYDSSVGLGRQILDLPKDKLNGELGGGYINEERTDAPRNDYGSGRAYAKYVRELTAHSNFSQDGEYIHNFNDSKAYRLNTETALTSAIYGHLRLKASFTWKRNAVPPPGAVRDDTITSMGLLFDF